MVLLKRTADGQKDGLTLMDKTGSELTLWNAIMKPRLIWKFEIWTDNKKKRLITGKINGKKQKIERDAKDRWNQSIVYCDT